MRRILFALLLASCTHDPLSMPDLAELPDAAQPDLAAPDLAQPDLVPPIADLASCGHFNEHPCPPPAPECIGTDPAGRPLVLNRATSRCTSCGTPDARCCMPDGGALLCERGMCDSLGFCPP